MLRQGLLLLLAWLACACACAGVPERPRFRVVGPAQGLPSTEIKALAHDRAGYLWIATADGLARHDGVGMRVWRYDPRDPGGLPGNNVQALLVDADDRVWVAIEGAGVSVLDARRDRFTHYRGATHPQLGSDDVWAMVRQGREVWLGTYAGGVTRVAASGAMRRFTQADGLPSGTVLALAVDAQGLLWVGTDKGLARQRGEGFEVVSLPGIDGVPVVHSLTASAEGLWAGTSLGAACLVDGRWQRPSWAGVFQRPNPMTSLVVDRQGDHWIGTTRGLWRRHGNAPPEQVRTGGLDIPRGVSALLLQADGALWAPVAGRGLGYLRGDWRQVARYGGNQDGLQGAMYRALGPASDGGAWLASVDGMVEHLGLDGAIQPLGPDALARLRALKPSAIAEDREGRLWIGHRPGLLRIGTDGAIDEWRADDALAPAPAGLISHVQVAADGSVWLAAPGGGVQQRDPASGRILRDLPAGPSSGLGEADIEVLVLAPGGEPWIAGARGVLRFDAAVGRFRHLAPMGRDRIYAIAFDGRDRLWTQGLSGLALYQRMRGDWLRTASVGPKQGLPTVAAAALGVDARHRVWMTSPRGLFRWDPARASLRRIGAQDGAGSEEYLDRAALLRSDGVLMGGVADGGVVLVDTLAPDPAPVRPVLRIAGVAVRRRGDWQELPPRHNVVLRADDRELRIGARLLAFDDPSGNRYWSRLEGFEREWVAMGTERERVFTSLAPGRYTLRMRAQDAGGNAAAEQSQAFVVPPPWWRTAWAGSAFAITGVLAVALLAWLYRERTARRHAWQLAEQKRVLAEQASDAKSRFLATLGHEVRTPMTGVLGMSELLQGTALDVRQRGLVDAIRHAGQHLLRLVDDALDLARIEAGRLELAEADFALRPLLDAVAGLMAPVAERKGLAFVDSVAGDAPRALHGDCTRVQQILLNLVGNAVKFTEVGYVALETFALAPHGVRFVVADTGPGLNAEQRTRLFRRFEQADGARTAARYGGSGLGLAISQELAAAMGGRIEVESEPGKGSRFIVDLPLALAGSPGASVPVPPVHARRASASLALLLVEDDAIAATAIAGLLRAQGHAVVQVAHGLAALGEAAAQRFDAALLDLDLPGMDGLALARLLRARGFPAPLLAVTARSDGEAEPQAKQTGFKVFLRKPMTGAMLAQALDIAMEAATGTAMAPALAPPARR